MERISETFYVFVQRYHDNVFQWNSVPHLSFPFHGGLHIFVFPFAHPHSINQSVLIVSYNTEQIIEAWEGRGSTLLRVDWERAGNRKHPVKRGVATCRAVFGKIIHVLYTNLYIFRLIFPITLFFLPLSPYFIYSSLVRAPTTVCRILFLK